MIIILLAAALISGVTSILQGESMADVFIILIVVIINAVLNVLQESKAEKAVASLQEMSAATSKVLRDGRQQTVASEALVPGDVILLEAGDAVPADARVIEAASLKVEEAALTGESVPVTKQTEPLKEENGRAVPLGDRSNMVYMGSTGRLRTRQSRHHADGHADRDGQDRRRAGQGRKEPDAASDQAFPAEQDAHISGCGHLRGHLRRGRSAA